MIHFHSKFKASDAVIQFNRTNIFTKLAGILIFLFVAVTHFLDKNWNQTDMAISGDVRVYYAYLPAIFINDDIDFKDPHLYNENGYLRVLYGENPDGQRYIRATCGMAIMYSPFFAVGHLLAYMLGEPMDGFSYPYLISLILGSLIYLAIGLIFLAKLLLRYFNDRVVAITLLVVYLGTNLFYYYTGSALYPHGFSFMLLVLILYFSVRWLDHPTIKKALVIGFSAGLLVLIRPVDVLFLLFLPIIAVSSINQLKERFRLFWEKKVQLMLMFLAALIVMIPQFMYNYHLSGTLIFNLYAHSGESFFFSDPHLLDILFSYRNGWLIYSPLMIFSVIGIILIRRKNEFGMYILFAGLLYYFVLASWWCWWYAGFGNRAFINLYPILAIPLAAFIQYFLQKSFYIRTSFKVIILAGIMLSLYQTEQYNRGLIHWGEMTKAAYWDVFLQEKPSEMYSTFLRAPNIEDRKKGFDRVFEPSVKQIYNRNYSFDSVESSDSTMEIKRILIGKNNQNGVIQIPAREEFFGDIRLPVSSEINEVYLTVWIKGAEAGEVHILLMNESQSFAKISSEIVENKGDWNKFHCYSPIPESLLADTLHFKIWNQARKDILVDRVSLQGRFRSFASVDVE